jgi:hypothetical protein
MATQSQVLQEFVYALGFKIDEAGGKKFREGLGESTKDAAKLGGTLIGVGMAVEKFVEGMSEGLEKLYFASQRTGASVESLQAFEGAAQRIGMEAGKASAAVENMTARLRASPGLMYGVLPGLGVDPNMGSDLDKVNKLLDRLQPMFNAGKGSVQQAQALNIMKMFGIDPDTATQMFLNMDERKQAEKEMADRIKESGLNMDEQAKESHKFMNSLRDMTSEFGIVASQVAAAIRPMTSAVIQFTDGLLRSLVKANTGEQTSTSLFPSNPNEGYWHWFWRNNKALLTGSKMEEYKGGTNPLVPPESVPTKPQGSWGVPQTGGGGGTWGEDTTGPAPMPLSGVQNTEWQPGQNKLAPGHRFSWNGVSNGRASESERLGILQDEMDDNLTKLSTVTDKIERERIEGSIAALQREMHPASARLHQMGNTTPGQSNRPVTGAAGKGGVGPVAQNVNISPTFNIQGGNAEQIATMVATKQDRVYGNALRNMKSAYTATV